MIVAREHGGVDGRTTCAYLVLHNLAQMTQEPRNKRPDMPVAGRIITAGIGVCVALFGVIGFVGAGSLSWKSGAAAIVCVYLSADLLQGAVRGRWPVFALLLLEGFH